MDITYSLLVKSVRLRAGHGQTGEEEPQTL
jgi:hypothetical protein